MPQRITPLYTPRSHCVYNELPESCSASSIFLSTRKWWGEEGCWVCPLWWPRGMILRCLTSLAWTFLSLRKVRTKIMAGAQTPFITGLGGHFQVTLSDRILDVHKELFNLTALSVFCVRYLGESWTFSVTPNKFWKMSCRKSCVSTRSCGTWFLPS